MIDSVIRGDLGFPDYAGKTAELATKIEQKPFHVPFVAALPVLHDVRMLG